MYKFLISLFLSSIIGSAYASQDMTVEEFNKMLSAGHTQGGEEKFYELLDQMKKEDMKNDDPRFVDTPDFPEGELKYDESREQYYISAPLTEEDKEKIDKIRKTRKKIVKNGWIGYEDIPPANLLETKKTGHKKRKVQMTNEPQDNQQTSLTKPPQSKNKKQKIKKNNLI